MTLLFVFILVFAYIIGFLTGARWGLQIHERYKPVRRMRTGRWSKYGHPSCKGCRKKTKPHHGHGYCRTCYGLAFPSRS